MGTHEVRLGNPHILHIGDSGEPVAEMINYLIKTQGRRRREQIVVQDTAFLSRHTQHGWFHASHCPPLRFEAGTVFAPWLYRYPEFSTLAHCMKGSDPLSTQPSIDATWIPWHNAPPPPLGTARHGTSPPKPPLWDTDTCARPAPSGTKQKCKAKVKEESSSVTCHRCLSL